MAKKLKSETLALDIIVNANQAQKNINNLGREINDTSFKIKELQQQQALLAKEGQKDSQAYKDLTKEIKLNRDRVKELKDEQDKLISSLSLEQKTISQLKRELSSLRKLYENSIPDSDQQKKYGDQIKVVSSRLNELQVGADLTGKSVDNLGGKFKGWIATAAATAVSIASIAIGFKKAINEYAAFDDLLVDVMKTTNLSKDAVKELNSQLQEIETRSSQEDLLGLARIAGKLGYNEINEITEFVKANNQIIVALNEDLGGNVEETVNKIGKLVETFKLRDLYSTEEAFLKVASALNELGMASTANEGYMVEFARRMSGIAPLAKISIDQIFGLGAALDQLNQTEEVSSTALSKLFVKLASDSETYSKYAGMQLKDFQKLLESDFMGAFTNVLQGVKKNANGINELAATLGDLGEDGGRVIGVLGSLADNVDLLKSSMDLAKTSMEEGTSITDEYNLKNESAAAKLEIAQKKVNDLWRELGEDLWPIMTSGLSIFQMFIKLLSASISFISENWKVITVLTIAITGWTIAANLNTLSQYANAKATTIATTATRLWNAALAANPIGLVVAALATLSAAIYLKSKRLTEAETIQKSYNDTIRESNKSIAAEKSSIEQSLEIALDRAKADDIRLAAVKRLREIMPNVLQDYSDEQIMAGNAKKAIDDYTKSLIKQATVRAMRAKLDKLAEDKIKEQERKDRGFSGATFGERWESMDAKTFFSNNWSQAYENHVKSNINTIESQEKLFAESVSKLESELMKTVIVEPVEPVEPGNGNGLGAGGKNTGADNAKRKAYQKELDEAEKHHQAILQQKGLFREDLSELDKDQLIELSKYQDEYQSKLDSINTKYGESLKTVTNSANQELKKRAKSEEDYINSILIKRQSESEGERSAYDDRLKKAGLFGIERESMTKRQLDALEILEREHKESLGKINSEALSKEIEFRLENNKDIIRDLRIQHMEELSEIKTLNQAKEYLSKNLSKKELSNIKTIGQARKVIQNQQMLEEQELLKKQLIDLTQVLIKAQETGEFNGIKVSEEGIRVLIEQIRRLKEEYGQLNEVDKTSNLDDKTDLLGMTEKEWNEMFDRLKKGKIELKDLFDLFNAAGQIWSQYNALVAAKENAQLQKDESANNVKKDRLKKRLDDGIISQEEYNKQTEKLDKEMDRKKAIVARNQAKRDRNVALMSAIVNTAKAVTSVLPNFILAAIVGAMGALQVGTIMATPLPEIPGAETGGNFLDVIRAQDGKKFRAKSDPNKRGFISSPTVLVGEKGKEWVANNDAVENPHIKPLLDVLDTAQRNGSINTMTLSDIASSLSTRIQGRQMGGNISGSLSSKGSGTNSSSSMEVFLKKNIETLEALDKRIANMEVKVALLGKGGFLEKMDELNNLKNNGSF